MATGSATAGVLDHDPSKRDGFTFGVSFGRGSMSLDLEERGFEIDSPNPVLGSISFGAFIDSGWSLRFQYRDAFDGTSRTSIPGIADRPFDTAHGTAGFVLESWRFAPLAVQAGLHVAFFRSQLFVVSPQTGDELLGRDTGFGGQIGLALPLVTFRSSAIELRVVGSRSFGDEIRGGDLGWELGYRLY